MYKRLIVIFLIGMQVVVNSFFLSAQTNVNLNDITWISDVSLSPDGDTLAIAGRVNGDSAIWLFDISTGDIDSILTGRRFLDIEWSPNGEFIAGNSSGQGTADILVYQIATKQLVVAYSHPQTSVNRLVWDIASSRIATAADGIIYIFDATSGSLISTANLNSSDMRIINDFYWDSGSTDRLYGLLGGDQTVIVWNATTGEEIQQIDLPYVSQSIAFNPDHTQLAVGSVEGHVIVLDPISGDTIMTFQNQQDEGYFVNRILWHPVASLVT